VSALLRGAGFGGVEFVKADDPMLMGRDVDDVLDYERASPSAAGALAGLGPAQAEELTSQVRNRLMEYASPDGVTMPGAAWLVTAHAVSSGVPVRRCDADLRKPAPAARLLHRVVPDGAGRAGDGLVPGAPDRP